MPWQVAEFLLYIFILFQLMFVLF